MSGQPRRFSVLAVEDHLIARTGIVSLLSTHPELHVVGQATDGLVGLALFCELNPDVVVTDLHMPKLDGVGLIEAILEEDIEARILVLTHYDGDENIVRAMRAGARGYVTKDAIGPDLADAVCKVARGERHVPAEIAAKLSVRVATGKGVSRREQQVLELLGKGTSNSGIAKHLGLGERTVEIYVSSLMKKLGARSRTAAVAIAYQRGLLLRP